MVESWSRTKDILTIVTPLLVGGSIVLALLHHMGADAFINTAFTPITTWWLGLPAVLGVPIRFGILRKQLSLLMIYQALGTFEVGNLLDWAQNCPAHDGRREGDGRLSRTAALADDVGLLADLF